MKIVLIRPPQTNRVWVGIPRFFNDGIFLFPPLGIMQLKAYIEKHTPYQVIIYDSLIHKADYNKLADFIKKISPQVVGISTFTHSLVDVVETAKAIKRVNPLIHIVLGGPHTYTFSDESRDLLELGCIDSVILGDGEETLKKLLYALDKDKGLDEIHGVIYRNRGGEVIKNGQPLYIENLDQLPFPSRNVHRFQRYYTPASHGHLMTTMITSRGCPYNCKFCNVQKKYRVRSIKNVIDEMQFCGKLGYKEIFFIDDTFNTTTERVTQLSEEILRRGFKVRWGCKARCDNIDKEMLKIVRRAGCVRIHYGVETGMNEGLDSISKRMSLKTIREALTETRKAGIRTVAYFMIGSPHEKDKSDILKTIDFARGLPADFAVFSLLSPYPDATFYKEGAERGVIDNQYWQQFLHNPSANCELPTCWQEHFSKDELLGFLKIAHRKFYYRPKIVFNALSDIHSFKELERLLAGGLSLLQLELFRRTDGRL